MTYQESIQTEAAHSAGFQEIILSLKALKGKFGLLYSHDDPDGVSSGVLASQILETVGAAYLAFLPPQFPLQQSDLDKAMEQSGGKKPEFLFVVDKGTLTHYDRFAEQISTFLLVDHHPVPEPPKNITFYNPCIERGTFERCSTSLLLHMILTYLGHQSPVMDFWAMVGIKGDWCVEPVTEEIGDFSRPFYEDFQGKYSNLTETIESRPTMFDVRQREKTCLISQITDMLHGACGGGFQYFYNDRDTDLAAVDHVRLCYDALWGLKTNTDFKPDRIKSLDDFFKCLPQEKLLRKIYSYFLSDWDRALCLLDTVTPIARLSDTGIYLFLGSQVPLLPMIGSIKLYEVYQKNEFKETIFVMVSVLKDNTTHFSLRGTGVEVHCGKICSSLSDLVSKKYNEPKAVSGGGHPVAAECYIRPPLVNPSRYLDDFLCHLNRMLELAEKNELNPKEKEEASRLGADFL